MWHILRPVVRWPLYSPRRLLLTVVGLVVVMMTTSQCSADLDPVPADPASTSTSSADPAPTDPTAEPSASPSASPSPKLEPGQGASGKSEWDPERAPWDPVEGVVVPALAPDEVAVMYVEQWAHPERTKTEWLAGLAPYVTANHYDELMTVDPANVEKLRVTGPAIEDHMGGDFAFFFVPVGDGEYVRVSLSTGGEFWLAAGAEPVR